MKEEGRGGRQVMLFATRPQSTRPPFPRRSSENDKWVVVN